MRDLIRLSEISNSEKKIYNQLEFVDIAGLVKGASKGEGLGNKFLSNLSQVDAIIHLVRCFKNKNITHVDDNISPLKDISVIETELLLSDLSKIENIIENLKNKNKGKKIEPNLIEAYKLASGKLNNGILLRDNKFTSEQLKTLNLCNFLTLKPQIFVCNVDEKSLLNGNELTDQVYNYAKKNTKVLSISAEIEAEIAQIENLKEKKNFYYQLV